MVSKTYAIQLDQKAVLAIYDEMIAHFVDSQLIRAVLQYDFSDFMLFLFCVLILLLYKFQMAVILSVERVIFCFSRKIFHWLIISIKASSTCLLLID